MVKCRHRNGDPCDAFPAHPPKYVGVAHDVSALGDNPDRVRCFLEHFQNTSHDFPVILDRLIRIGVRPNRDRPWSIRRFRQFVPQQTGGVRFGEQPGLEVQPWGKTKKSVRGACVAIDTSMLATSIRVDRAIESQVGRRVPCDYGPRRFIRNRRPNEIMTFRLAFPTIIECHPDIAFVPGCRVRNGSAAPLNPDRYFATGVHVN